MSKRDGVIVKKPKRQFFPHGGYRRSERHQNDPDNQLNRRRLRIDPLVDGYDPEDDPTKEDHTPDKKPDIPI